MARNFSPQEFEDYERTPLESPDRSSSRSSTQPLTDRPPASACTQIHAPGRSNQERPAETTFRNGRALLYERDRRYSLSKSEIGTLVELGKFRVVAKQNLVQHAYAGNGEQAGRDFERLVRQGLVQQGIFEGPEAHPRELLTLTERGNRLVQKHHLAPEHQAISSGFVKSREANHDADLYLLYQKEAAHLEALGGRHLRVILGCELIRKINREFAKLGPEGRTEIAARHGLEVVRNKIPVPDLQIEYETRDGEVARVNLELVTEHYRGRHVADKVRAGFSLYTPRGEADRLRRVLDRRELAAEILSL